MAKDREAGPSDLAARISAVLWNDWDPIGVNYAPETKREYDAYVPAIVKMVEDGATPEQIAEYLVKVEVEDMGLTGGNPEVVRKHALRIATLICDPNGLRKGEAVVFGIRMTAALQIRLTAVGIAILSALSGIENVRTLFRWVPMVYPDPGKFFTDIIGIVGISTPLIWSVSMILVLREAVGLYCISERARKRLSRWGIYLIVYLLAVMIIIDAWWAYDARYTDMFGRMDGPFSLLMRSPGKWIARHWSFLAPMATIGAIIGLLRRRIVTEEFERVLADDNARGGKDTVLVRLISRMGKAAKEHLRRTYYRWGLATLAIIVAVTLVFRDDLRNGVVAAFSGGEVMLFEVDPSSLANNDKAEDALTRDMVMLQSRVSGMSNLVGIGGKYFVIEVSSLNRKKRDDLARMVRKDCRGYLEFRLVAGAKGAIGGRSGNGTISAFDKKGKKYRLETDQLIAGAMFNRVDIVGGEEEGIYSLNIEFRKEWKDAFASVTEKNIGRQLAILYNGRILMAPVIRSAIRGGRAVIGARNGKELLEMASLMGCGILSASYRLVMVEPVGPTFGFAMTGRTKVIRLFGDRVRGKDVSGQLESLCRSSDPRVSGNAKRALELIR